MCYFTCVLFFLAHSIHIKVLRTSDRSTVNQLRVKISLPLMKLIQKESKNMTSILDKNAFFFLIIIPPLIFFSIVFIAKVSPK